MFLNLAILLGESLEKTGHRSFQEASLKVAMAITPYLIRTTLIFCLLDLAHSRVMRTDTSDAFQGEKGCEATFAEGQTATLTFFIGLDELAREDFFARLRRSDDPTGDIAICDRKSPVKCNIFNPRYKCEGIANDSFTVLIPNITRQFEDTYVFETYGKDEHQSTIECKLTVTDRVEKNKCNALKVTEGNTGTIEFFISVDMLSRQDFYARVRRAKEPALDIIVCDQTTSTKCNIINPRYRSNGIVNKTLTLWIPNISQDFEDTYILHTPPIFPDACHLTVEKRDILKGSENNDGDTSRALIGVMVCVIILAITTVVSSFCFVLKMRKNYMHTSLHWSGKRDGTGADEPLLSIQPDKKPNNQPGNQSVHDTEESSPEKENWFVEHMSREDEKLLLKYRRNGPGSFLIRQRITNPAHFTLSVLFEGEIQRFTIIPEKNGLRCIETEKCFPTLPHLVDWYKKQDIKVDDKVWGKLSKPFEKELEAEWYFGHITDKDETKLLKSGQEEKKGTFLVKDGTRGLHDYVLSVNHNGTVLHVPIVQRDNVFNVPDTGGSFQTVPELVDHYKEHDIQTGKGVFKLGKPADKVPEEEWYHEIFTSDEQIKLLQSNRKQPGYFLIAPGDTNPNDYILTVYFLEQWRRFPIKAERCGFMFLNTDMFFHSLHELVAYYSTKYIKEGSKVWGKLTKPFRKDPREKWYFGTFDTEEERKLLSVKGNGAGAFLIRVDLSDPDDYTLAVNVDGNLNYFKILSEENGFKVRDCTDCFHTLKELVDHYSDNELIVGNKSYGKLKTPFKRKEKESSTQMNAAAILNSPAGQRPELDIYS